MQSVSGVDGLGWAPNPPDAGSVGGFSSSGLNITVDQGEIVDQVYARRHRKGVFVISAQGITGCQGPGRLKSKRRRADLSLGMLHHPAPVVAQKTVRGSFSRFKNGLEFVVHALPVGFVYLWRRYGFSPSSAVVRSSRFPIRSAPDQRVPPRL